MITEHHSEQLAIWALRTRVWDYIVKPVLIDDLNRSIELLSLRTQTGNSNTQSRNMIKPSQSHDFVFYNGKDRNHSKTLSTLEYIENHYSEKIYVADLAERCEISQHQFSRLFKREKGTTFREYLVNYRLDKACELLKNSPLPVGDIGYAVGFTDHSYFTRIFRKNKGVSPSGYRSRHQ